MVKFKIFKVPIDYTLFSRLSTIPLRLRGFRGVIFTGLARFLSTFDSLDPWDRGDKHLFAADSDTCLGFPNDKTKV